MNDAETKRAYEQISQHIKAAELELSTAAEVARKHGIRFNWSGPAYGMGGSFNPEYTKDRWGSDANGWESSTSSCT